MAAHRFGRYFDEFTVGEVFEHALTKTITESDNNLFSLITMNHHPVHLDDHYAKSQHRANTCCWHLGFQFSREYPFLMSVVLR